MVCIDFPNFSYPHPLSTRETKNTTGSTGNVHFRFHYQVMMPTLPTISRLPSKDLRQQAECLPNFCHLYLVVTDFSKNKNWEKKISPGVIPNSVWGTMQAKKICTRVFFQTLRRADCAQSHGHRNAWPHI